MKRWVVSGASGLLFGAGLVVSGMTDPRNVVRFLDFFGRFDPKLAGVMGGAVGVHALGLWWGRRRLGTPPMASLVPSLGVDSSLVAGAALFGVGWGLAGYCPGPGIVAVGFGHLAPVLFLLTAVLGVLAASKFVGRGAARPSADEARAATARRSPSDAPATSLPAVRY